MVEIKRKRMRKILNIIPGKESCCILLYGVIGEEEKEVSCSRIAAELLEAETFYKKIDVRINSNGGNVYSGIAIFNAIRNSRADVTIYVDGIAASMASVIATCGRRVVMNRYSRLMIHNIQGGCYGNKEELEACIDELKLLEDMLADIYSKKMGIGKEQIKEEYFDGKDHWLTAEEALGLGLIDEIYDSEPLPENMTHEQVYTFYQNRLNTNLKQTNMIDELKKIALFANVANEEDALKRIEELEAENKALKKECETLKKKEKDVKKAELDALLNSEPYKEIVNESTRTGFQAMLEANYEEGVKVLNSLKRPAKAIDAIGKTKTGKSKFDARFEEIEKKIKK